jgi:prepilin-type N-terminal cleavage/methylation domain-containing protein
VGLERSKRTKAGGFTLIEMALVLIIIGILFGVSAMRFDTLTDDSRLRASAREIGSTVAVGFSEALVKKQRHTLVFDTENMAYWVATEDEPEGSTAPGVPGRRYLYRGVTFKDIQVGDDLFEEAGILKVDISPLGISSACLVHLKNEDETELTVRIHPLTGSVSYYDGYMEYEAADGSFEFAE